MANNKVTMFSVFLEWLLSDYFSCYTWIGIGDKEKAEYWCEGYVFSYSGLLSFMNSILRDSRLYNYYEVGIKNLFVTIGGETIELHFGMIFNQTTEQVGLLKVIVDSEYRDYQPIVRLVESLERLLKLKAELKYA